MAGRSGGEWIIVLTQTSLVWLGLGLSLAISAVNVFILFLRESNGALEIMGVTGGGEVKKVLNIYKDNFI